MKDPREKSLKRRRRLALTVVASTVFAAAGAASCTSQDMRRDLAGDPDRGLAYAKQECASCHAVDAMQARSPSPLAPSFQTLADRPDMTRMTLSALLRSPHRSMPNLIVDPERVDDLSAYLTELRRMREPI